MLDRLTGKSQAQACDGGGRKTRGGKAAGEEAEGEEAAGGEPEGEESARGETEGEEDVGEAAGGEAEEQRFLASLAWAVQSSQKRSAPQARSELPQRHLGIPGPPAVQPYPAYFLPF